jgi:hypothetical protein
MSTRATTRRRADPDRPYDEGRAELNRIIEERPDLATAYFNTAIAYLLEGNIPETMNWIQRGADRCNPAILQKYWPTRISIRSAVIPSSRSS